jgi:hypothetical protein
MKIIDRIKSRKDLKKRIDNHYRTMKIDSMRKAIEYMDYVKDGKDRELVKDIIIFLFVVLVMFALYLVS